jgi:plastocyanin
VAAFVSASVFAGAQAKPAPPDQAKPAPGKTVQIVISGIAFGPVEIKANVGDTIEWLNKDIVDHTATARNKAFDLTIPIGKKVTYVVKTAGTVAYYCRFHPNMTGQLVVAAKPAK